MFFTKANDINRKLSLKEKGLDKERLKRQWAHLKAFSQSRISIDAPYILYHYITSKCGATCPYCYYTSGGVNDLTTVEILTIYEQAQELGFIGTVISGGEPFTRPDLPIILEFIKKKEMSITLMTNGNHLVSRWSEVKDFVDLLVVSVDIPDDALEKIRRYPDTFQNIVNGIDFVKESSQTPIVINSILWKENKNYIKDLASFAQDLNVSINFFPMDAVRTFRKNEEDSRRDLAMDYSELSESFQLISNLKQNGYPIINSQSYIDFYINYKPNFTCRFLQVFTQIMANGDVANCSAWSEPLGNVRTNTLDKILFNPQAHRARKNAHSCNNCNRLEVIETSLSYSWHLDALKNIIRMV